MSNDFKYNYAQIGRESGFRIHSGTDGQLDWRLIGCMEIERILREQSLEQIDSVLDHLSEVPLRSLLETNILDTGISKYFVLSQFSIQYLLFCRKFLEETVFDLKRYIETVQKEIGMLKSSLSESKEEILHLHKTITQMEAIREIIYPCHLCNKNFVSNDSLNLHIARKHNTDRVKYEGRMDTQITSGKEDIALINIIKLELEIKHLKERLNVAERKMKDHDFSVNNKACDNFVTKHNIGIQSNLFEIKEKDENILNNSDKYNDTTGYNSVLHNNLQELQQWKEEQKVQNSIFLNDIENKLRDLTQSLRMSQNEQEQKLQMNKTSTTEDVFEILLTRKVEEIGAATAALLNEAVYKMETSYSNKLEQLENKLQKITKNDNISDVPREMSNIVSHNITLESHSDISESKAKKQEMVDISSQDEATKTSLCNENINVTIALDGAKDNTNVKTTLPQTNGRPTLLSNHADINDCKHVKSVEGLKDKIKTKDREYNKIVKSRKTTLTHIQSKVTRKSSYLRVNSILLDLGIDINTKCISPSKLELISGQLIEKRNLLQDKHNNFYATRNNIKKSVNKLCSLKMPVYASTLLKATRVLQRKKTCEAQTTQQYFTTSENDGKLCGQTNIPRPLDAAHKGDLKQRLENILASPIEKPEARNIRAAAILQNSPSKSTSMPMHRKRVMFSREHTNKC